ncbi:MAG: sigma 54-interacting transcriptional regulator, partial [Myxococcota bacterium]|nr:sigma 54-interacting transcriptional regulator [Myxococcota bacterium]
MALMIDRTDDATETAISGKRQALSLAPWGLEILHSPDAASIGRWVPLGTKQVIGRSPGDGAITVLDPRLSRAHLEIAAGKQATKATIRDLDSKNGTTVKGELVTTCRVDEGTILRIGDTFVAVGRRAVDLPIPSREQGWVGRSERLRTLLDQLQKVAPTHLSVLLSGESGTGKELAAAFLHEHSGRTGQLVAVNCGAIPDNLVESQLFGHVRGAFTGADRDREGLVDRAAGGTLLLDEVGELPLALQPKLLRVLESGDYTPVGSTRPKRADVRVVAATHVDLQAAVREGRFRQDLYARLAGYTVTLPPLRERLDDVPSLARHFVNQLVGQRRVALSGSFVEALLNHSWPMNVREVRSAVESAAALHPGHELLEA